jgi:N,N'-diacetyllegionaminate synthase
MADSFLIGKKSVGADSPCFIIAEAGVNHNGSIEIAKRLIDVAIEAGVDAVKFQTFKTENVILDNVEKASYQKVTTTGNENQSEMIQKLEIDKEFHVELLNYCSESNVIFLSTPYDSDSLQLLEELDISAFKIASTDTTNLLFLEEVAKCGKPIILSTGMCTLGEIEQAYKCLKDNGCKNISVLKCTSNYPTADNEVNLRAMSTLKKCFDSVIGFSDHTEGVGASPYAIALGAKIVEKHFTIDKSMAGPDHQASLSPVELKKWVDEIRKVEEILGSAAVGPTKSELENKISLQKCIVTQGGLNKNDIISRNNITSKRTGGVGIPASFLYKILGLRTSKPIATNKPLLWGDLND